MRIVRSLKIGGLAALGIAAVVGLAASVAFPPPKPITRASGSLEERKTPMRFKWVDCQPNCRGWISAVGIVTSDTPRDFDTFARDRQLQNAAIVLDSSGGSVNDAIALGRRWRNLNLSTTVGMTIEGSRDNSVRPRIIADAYCESMCVFLLLSGTTRYVPSGAHVRVHQIWMGDRADDARAASYSAQDLMIVERDIGRLAKFTFDMGGSGDLLALALSVPPWEELHELSTEEIKTANLVTTNVVATLFPPVDGVSASVAELNAKDQLAKDAKAPAPKPLQDRVASDIAVPSPAIPVVPKSTRTAEAGAATAPAVANATSR